ncbi:MAG: PAS domain-containing protein [Desulfobacter sp.]|nr:MAG: PAS domain-containing protein [Desulfobacter sp.]
MIMKFLNKKISIPMSPLMMAGVLGVLLPLFVFMTLDRMEKQNEHFKERFMVKGISLIRTFEAGTRTGMLTMGWGLKRVQAMLVETASQPEIAYIMITDAHGKVLAHSDPEQMGTRYETLPDILALEKHQVFSRTCQMDGKSVFEVYKRFVPLNSGRRSKHGRHMKTREMHDMQRRMAPGLGHDPYFFETGEYFIFAGLSMARVEALQKKMTRLIIGRGFFFFILGCAGIIALFAFQAYQSAKASLNRVQAFSDNVVQNMPSGLITLNLECQVTSANRAARDMLGQIPEKAYPQMIYLALEMNRSKAAVTREVVLEHGLPAKLRLDMTASPILDHDGHIQAYILLFRDITQVEQLKKEVETNRRLAAIGKLAGGVAHEIRNPLSSIKGFATYFANRYENEPEDLDTARIMVQEVERINRSITQLLEFAKPMIVEIKAVEVESLIRHSLKLVSHDLEKKNITTNLEIKTCCRVMKTDPDRINQVLLNLYMNSLNAMAGPGILTVSVVDVENGVQIRVADTGCGIDPKDMEEIFDPYFTTRPQGTGLGLSIVHRIVENLKGEVRVESQKGKGSCFIIDLPVLDPDFGGAQDDEERTKI